MVHMTLLLRSSVALAAIVTLGAQASAAEKVTFGTNWLAQPEHGGFYQAVADGTYEACGLDVTIAQGGPQVNNRALLLAGKVEFHMGGNMLEAFSAVEQDIPVKVVAAAFQKEPQVLMTHPGQGLDTWEELKNADEFILGDAGFQSYFQWMVTEFGFDAAKRVPYTFNPAPFIANPKSAQQGYVTSEPFAVEREGGFKPNLFLLADYGFDTYSTTIEVMQATIDSKPEAVKCFVEGSIKGWYNYLYGDNAVANEMIKKDNPDMTDEQIAFSIEKLKEYGIVDSGDTETMGIGAMTDARMESFYAKMVKAGVVKDGIDIKASYTLDYVNAGIGLDLKK
ncbi:ABC transporter substrate-binding protein [Hoeflea olei]|uniref:Nitrate ABC transporter substrate-binding protein n=1 Tax=Hoeflea olei TaxID=1480615 RepID=A0A1C1YXB8_9HYPH|nr:ABC transporter substrate-binding protein [Hoeflea olei]OCW58193.1 nitrate ABC transporter substrate-binding protein [Hoeflea olei]